MDTLELKTIFCLQSYIKMITQKLTSWCQTISDKQDWRFLEYVDAIIIIIIIIIIINLIRSIIMIINASRYSENLQSFLLILFDIKILIFCLSFLLDKLAFSTCHSNWKRLKASLLFKNIHVKIKTTLVNIQNLMFFNFATPINVTNHLFRGNCILV